MALKVVDFLQHRVAECIVKRRVGAVHVVCGGPSGGGGGVFGTGCAEGRSVGGAPDAPMRRRQVGRRRRRGASRQAYQPVAGLAHEPHSLHVLPLTVRIALCTLADTGFIDNRNLCPVR